MAFYGSVKSSPIKIIKLPSVFDKVPLGIYDIQCVLDRSTLYQLHCVPLPGKIAKPSFPDAFCNWYVLTICNISGNYLGHFCPYFFNQ